MPDRPRRDNLLPRLAAWPAERPVAALLISGVCLALALVGILRTRADTSIETVLSPADPASAAMIRIVQDFPSADEMLLLATTPDGSGGSGALTAFAARLDESLRADRAAAPLVKDVIWRVDEQTKAFFGKVLVPSAVFYLDDAGFAAARERLTKERMAEQVARNEAMLAAPGPAADALAQTLLQDPLRLHEFLLERFAGTLPMRPGNASGAFLSPDGRSLLIRIRGTKPPGDIDFSKQITAAVERVARSVNTDGLALDLSGAYAIATASERAMRRDSIDNVIESVVALQLLFVLVYRRPIRLFLLAFLPVAVGITLGFGAHYLYSPVLPPPTAVVGAILAGVAIDHTTHYLTQYQTARGRGLDVVDALVDTTTSLFGALLAACATTIVGFFAIAFSSLPALRDFAVVGSLGLTGAFLATLWILPALVRLTDRGPAETGRRMRFDLVPLLAAVRDRRGPVLTAAVALTVAAAVVVAWPGQRLPPEDDLTVLHPRPNPPLDAQAKIAERMGTSADSMLVYLKADSGEELVRLAHRVQRALAQPQATEAGITGTFGLSTLLPDPDAAKARATAISPDAATQIVADFRAVIAESNFSPEAYEPYAKFLEQLLTNRSVPTLADLRPYEGLAGSILSRGVLEGRPGSFEAITLAFVNRPIDTRDSRMAAVTALRGALADVPGATLTGLSVIGFDAELAVHRDLPKMLISSVVFVTAYLFLHYRNLRTSLLALVPLLVSMLCVVAVMRLTGQKLNAVNLIAIPLLVGITVDYGIFVIGLWQHRGPAAFRGDLTELAATGQAVTVSAASTVIGFGTLMWTSVPAFRSLGWTVAVGVVAALAATFFLQAPLLLRRPAKGGHGLISTEDETPVAAGAER